MYRMEPYSNYNQNEFFTDIIEALHMKADTFMYNLSHHNPYEMLLYVWIYKLYNKKKSIEEATQLIYKARNILLLHSSQAFCNTPQ